MIENKPPALPRSFFSQPTTRVARQLLGKWLVSTSESQKVAGVIVETEAYLPANDSACHANQSRTPRTEVMFGQPGLAYVYPIHAKVCFNVVTESEERGCAVLIRAIEPLVGLDAIVRRRQVEDPRRLTTGPAILCQALGIDRSFNGHDLTQRKQLWIAETPVDATFRPGRVKRSPRIGVTSAKDKLLRYYFAGNPFVSGPRRLRT